jgi:hypothetical protein
VSISFRFRRGEVTVTHRFEESRRAMQRNTARFTIGLATSAVAAAGLLGIASASPAARTSGPDLAMTGASVVAGVKVTQGSDQLVPFSFTAKNNSSRVADLNFTFTVTHGSPAPGGYICPLPVSKVDINPDSPNCELGSLAAGHSSSAGIIVSAIGASGQYVTVKACVSDFTATDPVSSNNCRTLKVKIA